MLLIVVLATGCAGRRHADVATPLVPKAAFGWMGPSTDRFAFMETRPRKSQTPPPAPSHDDEAGIYDGYQSGAYRSPDAPMPAPGNDYQGTINRGPDARPLAASPRVGESPELDIKPKSQAEVEILPKPGGNDGHISESNEGKLLTDQPPTPPSPAAPPPAAVAPVEPTGPQSIQTRREFNIALLLLALLPLSALGVALLWRTAKTGPRQKFS
jgi:hypothetical protein